jgi:succinyl-CoA synthetase beta subunit
VTEAFRIILADDRVKGILVNIFGGIMDCAVIAQGIVNAAKEIGFEVPLVVRLEGTNVDAGREILRTGRERAAHAASGGGPGRGREAGVRGGVSLPRRERRWSSLHRGEAR